MFFYIPETIEEKDFLRFDFIRKSTEVKYSNLGAFGLEINEGWYPLVWILCCQIEEYLRSADPKLIQGFYVTQIKEKFGGLRFYTSCYDDGISLLIRDAEQLSVKICEVCGAPGKTRALSWVRALCKDHFYEELKDIGFNSRHLYPGRFFLRFRRLIGLWWDWFTS